MDSEKYYQYSDEDYFHMSAISDYVFATIPSSPERDRRLSEISEGDRDKLWDFYCGKLSGRIKEPKTKQYLGGTNTMTFEQYKQISGSNALGDMQKTMLFEQQYPSAAASFKRKIEADRKRRQDILSIPDRNERVEAIARNLSLF